MGKARLNHHPLSFYCYPVKIIVHFDKTAVRLLNVNRTKAIVYPLLYPSCICLGNHKLCL